MAARDRHDVESLVTHARHVVTGSVSLQAGESSIRGSYPIEPCRHAGIDPDDPGEYPWAYDKREQVLVIDLGGEHDEHE